jgi:hypothetical protein
VTHLGLPSTFEVLGSIVAPIALVVAFEARRTRPTRTPIFRHAPEPARP